MYLLVTAANLLECDYEKLHLIMEDVLAVQPLASCTKAGDILIVPVLVGATV
jgi:hypothetical protein